MWRHLILCGSQQPVWKLGKWASFRIKVWSGSLGKKLLSLCLHTSSIRWYWYFWDSMFFSKYQFTLKIYWCMINYHKHSKLNTQLFHKLEVWYGMAGFSAQAKIRVWASFTFSSGGSGEEFFPKLIQVVGRTQFLWFQNWELHFLADCRLGSLSVSRGCLHLSSCDPLVFNLAVNGTLNPF